MKIEFHPEASLEFQAAADFYENEVPGLGEGFISEVELITALIEAHPAIGKLIDEVFHMEVLVRFPFSVISKNHMDKHNPLAYTLSVCIPLQNCLSTYADRNICCRESSARKSLIFWH